MITYLIIAFDADDNELTRSTVTSDTVTACHHHAKSIGKEMLERGANNVIMCMNGRTMGFMPDCDALPLDYWTESVNTLPV